MKGYKATYNMKCRDFTYKVGKTYETDDIEICKKGFHYCVNPNDVLYYYPYDEDFILLEVEDLGNTIIKGDKSVTDKLKIVRVIPKEEYESLLDIELDDKGRILYQKYCEGCEYWYKYDSEGKEIHFKNSNDGYESWSKYDSKGYIIYQKLPKIERWYEYDASDRLIRSKDSDGCEFRHEYDSEGKDTVYFKGYNGVERKI